MELVFCKITNSKNLAISLYIHNITVLQFDLFLKIIVYWGFVFVFHFTACGILVPQPGMDWNLATALKALSS